MFELHVADKNISTGSVAVSWCVSKETLDALRADGIKTPHVVLVLAPTGDNYEPYKEIRKIVPLKDLIAYLDFNRSGEMKIWAFIARESSFKGLKDRWLSRAGAFDDHYENSIIRPSGSDYVEGREWLFLEKADPISVIIPEQAFAAPPSEFEQNWVNHFFSKKPQDQCAFRRRRFFAYLLQPFIMLGDTALKLIITLCLMLWGARDLKPLYPFQPYVHINSVLMDSGNEGTIFVGKGKSTFWNWIRLPFMPLIAVPLFFIIRAIIISGSVFKALMIVGSALLLLGLLIGGAFLFDQWMQAEENKDAWYTDPNEVELIVCSGQQKPFSLKHLPPSHRTFRLRFNALKSQVCRPFAK